MNQDNTQPKEQPLLPIDPNESFEDYMRNSRNEFVMEINRQEWNTKLRTTAEDLLICFDQMRERLLKTPTNIV